MKILLVIDHLDPGGAQHQMVTLARGLVERGHDVSCFVYYPHMDHHRGSLDDAGIPVYSTRKSSRLAPGVPFELRRRIRHGFDVSLSYLTTPNIYNVLASVGTGVPTIVSERSALVTDRAGLGLRARYQFYRFANRILVNSEHQRIRLEREFPWMRSRLVTIRNGVDLEHFRPPQHPKLESSDHLDLLAIGSLNVGKNFIGLIEAVRTHRESFGWAPSVRWAGRPGTSEEDVHAFERAEHLIDKYGLRSSWHWLGVRRDIPDLLREADALVHPSFFEGLPNVVCEALATGLPVLAGRVCDHPWLVGEGERGFLFEPSEPSDIARAFQELAALSPDELQRMRLGARRFAEAELSLTRFVTQYEDLFREVAVG